MSSFFQGDPQPLPLKSTTPSPHLIVLPVDGPLHEESLKVRDVWVEPMRGEDEKLLLDLLNVVGNVVQDLDGNLLAGVGVHGLEKEKTYACA